MMWIASLFMLTSCAFAEDDCASPTDLHRCTSASPMDRAKSLLEKLSIEEIIQQTWSPYGGSVQHVMKKIGNAGVGQLSFGIARGHSLTDVVSARNAVQQQVMNSSLHGIPTSFSNEALHSAVAGGTVFPELVTQGATWNAELIQEIGQAIALEARSVGVDTAFSPVLNMWVDSRFGRLQEGYSENPTLTAAYAAAQARGLQGEQPPGVWDYFNQTTGVVALAKHYLAYGAAIGGLNGAPAQMSERTVREWYLKPWRSFAAAGGKAAMTSHNSVLGQPMHANSYLTNSVFRGELNFGDGFIISDCNDIEALQDFRVAANASHAAAKGIRGGVDLDLQCGSNSAYTHLHDALKDGTTTLPLVKQAALRVLAAKYALGLFESPITDEKAHVGVVNSPEHQALALKAAEQGIVLLKNGPGAGRASLLPLHASDKVAVIGPNGGCQEGQEGSKCPAIMAMLGSYTQYSGFDIQTVAAALSNSSSNVIGWAFGADTEARPAAERDPDIKAAVALAKRSDVAVLVVGDSLHSSSEWGDRDNLDLPGDQLQLLEAVAATGVPVVVVLVTGRTATFGPNNMVLRNVSGIFSTFRPGQMGGVAVANLLTGKANPSGKLAQNWVRSVGQVMSGASPWLQWRVGKWVANHRSPPDADGRVYDPYNDGPATPLFRFGTGLSYTSFSMSNLRVSSPNPGASPLFSVSVSVRNTGSVSGTEVVQVYIIDPIMEYVRPWKRLLAFQRVTLDPGAETTVTIPVSAAQMSFQDDSSPAGKWAVVSGEYQVRVGNSSQYDLLTTTVRVP